MITENDVCVRFFRVIQCFEVVGENNITGGTAQHDIRSGRSDNVVRSTDKGFDRANEQQRENLPARLTCDVGWNHSQ